MGTDSRNLGMAEAVAESMCLQELCLLQVAALVLVPVLVLVG